MSKKITRRASLDALVLTSTIVNGALAQPRAAFGGVHVDVASLRAEVGDPTARDAEELPGAVAQALAGVGRAGAPVAVRVDTAILGSSSGGAAWCGRSARPPATIRWPSTRRSSNSPTTIASRNSCRPSPIGRPGRSEVARSSNAPGRRSGTGCAIQVVDQTPNHACRGGVCGFSRILAMILTSNTRLTDRITEWLGRRLARYLAQPVKDFVPLATADPGAFLRALRPGDIVLIEGNTRVSTAIKYLTQSTWSHSALYVGPISGRSEPSGEPHVLVEADVEHGVLSAPASKYSRAHTRICRPVGLSADEIRVVTDFAVDRIGLAYDLRNTFDLLRYLLPTPPVPSRLRRRMIALGAGSPTRAICSTLIAQAFQAINYPILPPIEDIAAGQTGMASLGLEGVHEFAHIRHYSLFAPRDFDISPYFMVVKPTIEACFNHHSVKWSSEKGRIEGEQSELHQRQRTQSHPDEHADGERGLGRVTGGRLHVA